MSKKTLIPRLFINENSEMSSVSKSERKSIRINHMCHDKNHHRKPSVPRERIIPTKSEHLLKFKMKYPSLYEKLRSAIVQYKLLGDEKGIGKKKNSPEPSISEWNDFLENNFKETRKKKRLALAKFNIISSLDDLTMNEMRKNNLISSEVKAQKTNKTKSYAEVIESLKTEPFFINYMKRKEVEKEIMEIGPDLFGQIELEVAEEVIGDYNNYLCQIKNLRKKYLQERSKRSSSRLLNGNSTDRKMTKERSYDTQNMSTERSVSRSRVIIRDRPISLLKTKKNTTVDLYTGGPNRKKFE